MQIPKKYAHYFSVQPAKSKFVLADHQTKLTIQANDELYSVMIDRGILASHTQGFRKCDYLIMNEDDREVHLIELKGQIIADAYSQLEATVDHIQKDQTWQPLFFGSTKRLDAYIVSATRQRIPKGINTHERTLAKKLAGKSIHKESDILNFIKYVRIIPSQTKLAEKDRHIICSGQAPLNF